MRVARVLVTISIGWVLLIFACLVSSLFELVNKPPPLTIQLARGGGVLVVGTIVLMLHLLALWTTKRGDSSSRRKALLLVLPAIGITLIAYLTGFTIGPLLYPSVILLLLASLLSFLVQKHETFSE